MRSRSVILPGTASVLPCPRIPGDATARASRRPTAQRDLTCEAEVIQTFASGFYLAVDDPGPHAPPHRWMLPIMGPEAMVLPFGVVVPTLDSTHLRSLQTGARASVVGEPPPARPQSSHPRTAAHGSQPTEPPVIREIELPDFTVDVVREHRPMRVPALRWPDIDRARVTELSRRLHPGSPDLADRSLALASALCTGDAAGAQAGVKALVGFGTGSTPSGDDALCGIALGLRCLGKDRDLDLLRQVLDPMPLATMTPVISGALIRAAVSGFCVPAVAAAIRTCHRLHASTSGGESLVGDVLEPLDRIGHSSGHDLFTGFLSVLTTASGTRAPHSPLRSVTESSSKGSSPCLVH